MNSLLDNRASPKLARSPDTPPFTNTARATSTENRSRGEVLCAAHAARVNNSGRSTKTSRGSQRRRTLTPMEGLP